MTIFDFEQWLARAKAEPGAIRTRAQVWMRSAQLPKGTSGGEPMTAPPGCRFFTVVRNIMPGVCARLLVLNREGAETDLSEGTSREIWEVAAKPCQWDLVEASVRKRMAARA